MRLTRLQLVITLTSLALFGAYWVVRAQESLPVFAPPPVLPPAPTSRSAKPKPNADPSLIIPAEVYEIPRPLGPLPAKPLQLDIIQAGGQLPPPMFPATPEPKGTTGFVAPEAAPLIEMKPLAAPQAPERDPTRVLLLDPPTRESPKKEPALPMPPPLPISPPVVAPPPIAPALKKSLAVSPDVTMPVPDAPPPERVKSFVRIRSGASSTPLEMTPGAVAPFNPPANSIRPVELPVPSRDALVNLQTPTITVEKRGPTSLRASETQLYYLVIHNYGAIAAQQIRIEDDIPADVRLLSADPMPQMQGTRAVWTLSSLAPGAEQSVRMTLKADANVQLTANTSVHVSSGSVAVQAKSAPVALSVRLNGPERVSVGKPAVFEIQVNNPTGQPLTGIVLYGDLPDGLTTPAGNKIEGEVNGMIAPGDFKILKMPTTAVKPGRYTVQAKVVTAGGEGSATTSIDVGAESLFVQQAPTTRLVPGRDGDLRIELANNTGKEMRNVTVANLLPAGFVFIAASDRGLYQANTRTVHWLLDQLPAGGTKTLVVRVNGDKLGQYQNLVSARADGVAELRSAGVLLVEGLSDLSMRVIDRDNPIEVGRETVYEIQVLNPGSAPVSNVRLQVQFPPGLIPKNAQSNGRFNLERDSVVFEPIASLAPQAQAIFRVSATAQTAGKEQRVRFSVVSDEVARPIQREINVMIYSGN